MEKFKDKIIVYKNLDVELYNLLSKIDVIDYGIIRFDGHEVKEINVKKRGRPNKVITIERNILLTPDVFKDSKSYGD